MSHPASNTSVRVARPFGRCTQSGFGREFGMVAIDATPRPRAFMWTKVG